MAPSRMRGQQGQRGPDPKLKNTLFLFFHFKWKILFPYLFHLKHFFPYYLLDWERLYYLSIQIVHVHLSANEALIFRTYHNFYHIFTFFHYFQFFLCFISENCSKMKNDDMIKKMMIYPKNQDLEENFAGWEIVSSW